MTIQDDQAANDQAANDPAASDRAADDPAGHEAVEADSAEHRLPTISEQVAEQLGGWRGLIESSVPVLVFVIANAAWGLRYAAISSVAFAVALALLRMSQRRPVRHAVNGLFGVALGAVFALRTGEARDFYLPGILYGLGYSVALLASIAVGRPLVGWIWSIVADGGSQQWRANPRLLRTFGWLTGLWAATWIAKVGVQAGLYLAHEETALAVARIALGYPPYLLLLAITVWTVRRVLRTPAPPMQPG